MERLTAKREVAGSIPGTRPMCSTRRPCGHTASSYDLFSWLEMCVCTIPFHFNAPQLQGTAKSLTLLAIYYHDCLVQQSIINIRDISIMNQLTISITLSVSDFDFCSATACFVLPEDIS